MSARKKGGQVGEKMCGREDVRREKKEKLLRERKLVENRDENEWMNGRTIGRKRKSECERERK